MVRKNEREPSRFETADVALALATHTYNITSNPKIFAPIHYRLINRLTSEATFIYQNIRVANEIKAATPEDARERYKLQKEALKTCKALTSDIMISKGVFHLRMRKVIFWNKYIERLEVMIKAWMESDMKNYNAKWQNWDVG
jgi:hypothetical protein